jgi:hypothetical protein
MIGSFKVPYGGFKQFPIKITKLNNNNLLPVAHTCFNTIDLPEYQSKEIMMDKLNIALTEGLR